MHSRVDRDLFNAKGVLGAIARYGVSFCFAMLVTFGLFFLMQYLIVTEDVSIDDSERIRVIDFVRLKHESVAQPRTRALPEKPRFGSQPIGPDLEMAQPVVAAASVPAIPIAAPKPDIDFKFKAGPQLGPAPTRDADEIPLVRVEPQYPPAAARDHIEGWVRVQFDVGPTGRVLNPMVLEARPRGVFEQEALRAIKKWRYRPKVRDGVAVERKGIRVRLTFKMMD
jgi:protein TonB